MAPPTAQAIIRNRNQPAAFVAGNAPASFIRPPASDQIPAQTDTAQESYNRQHNIEPESPPGIPTIESPTGDNYEPQIETPAYNPNAPGEANARTEAVRQSITAPYLAQIEANRKRAAVLKTMPITDKDGNTMSGWKAFATKDDPEGDEARKKFTDTDGRAKSGLKAFLQSLGNNPQLRNVRDWGDLAKSLTYSAAAGVGGAINSSWNEEQKRSAELAKIEDENKKLQSQAEDNLKLAGQESVIENRKRTADRQDEVFENRVNQQKYKQVQDQKKEVLAPIFKRGFFYHDSASPEELQRLEAAGVVLDDFDTTKKPYNDKGGVRKVWDVRAREFVAAKGDEPDEPLVATEIDGVRINLKPSEFANYKAQEGRTKYDTAVRDADNDQEYNDKMQRWQADEDKRQQDNIKLANDGNAANNNAIEQEELAKGFEEEARRLADDNPTEAVKLRGEARKARAAAGKLRSEGGALLNRAQNSKSLPKPVKQAKLPVYNSSVQTEKFTDSEVRARIKAKNPNATEADYKAGIQKVKDAGAMK